MNLSLTANFSYIFDDIYMMLLPEERSIANLSNATINFTLISTNSSLVYFGLNITSPNGTMLFTNASVEAAGGTISGNFSAVNVNGTWVNATIYFLKENYGIWKQSHIFYITEPGSGGMQELFNIDIPMFAKSIIVLFFALVIGISVGKYNAIGGGIIVMVFLGIMTFLGWFDAVIYTLLMFGTFAIVVLRGNI